MILFVFVRCIFASLTIYSSKNSTNLTLDYYLTPIGSPNFYAVYGQLKIISNISSFSSLGSLSNRIVFFTNYSSTSLSHLALLSQKAGASAVYFLSSNNLGSTNALPDNPSESSQVLIPCLTIKNSDGSKIFSLSDPIWSIAQYNLRKQIHPDIVLYLTGNYSLDKNYILPLSDLAKKMTIKTSALTLRMNRVSSDADGITISTDCFKPDKTYYCMAAGQNTTGSAKVMNSFYILQRYSSLGSNESISNFINSLRAVYATCELDYSQSCISSYLGGSYNLTASNVKAFEKYFGYYDVIPYATINDLYILIPSSFESAYCLSSTSPSENCTQCSPGCSYAQISSKTCNPSCNTTACGFDNLKCILTDNCYNFLVGDGQCDSACKKDYDCLNHTDVCTSGCLYSDMANNKCPAACTGLCFSSCSSNYCSPMCTYQDLSAGICSSLCTSSCKAKCNTDLCADGCNYSSMKSGKCPANCTGTCFSNCDNSIYCSAGCTYSDLNTGKCDYDVCSKDCLQLCNSSNICAIGCYYSEMQNNKLCPTSCTGNCFSSCDSNIYCSPGCKYTDLESGQCSNDCSNSCLEDCNKECADHCNNQYEKTGVCPNDCDIICCRISKSSSEGFKVLYIILCSVIGGVVSIIGICVLCYLRFKMIKNNENNFRNSIDATLSRVNVAELKEDKMLEGDFELQVLSFNNDIRFIGDAVCTIDLTGFRAGDKVVLTPCMHIFHMMCIKEWLEAVGRERRCPNCNFALEKFKINLE